MARVRVELDIATVNEAIRRAKAGDEELVEYADAILPGLVLRVRGKAIMWLYKTRRFTKSLGSPPDVGVREARKLAKTAPTELEQRAAAIDLKFTESTYWTWEQLADGYMKRMSEPRMLRRALRQPSVKTIKDIRTAFARPALAVWKERRVNTLDEKDLVAAARATMNAFSHRQATKMLDYIRGALSWAKAQRAAECGLTGALEWWKLIKVPEPEGAKAIEVMRRQRPTANPQFRIEHLARLLLVHESFCAGTNKGRKVSPGIHYGLWWLALTVARTGAAFTLRHNDIAASSSLLPAGWGMATWSAGAMKSRSEFVLPIPSIGVTVLRGMQREWRERINRSQGFGHRSQWVWASTQRQGRDPNNADPRLSGDAIKTHLSTLRGERHDGRMNMLEGLPRFSLHTFRSLASTHLFDRGDVLPSAISAMLAHRLPDDRQAEQARMSQTTERYYLTTQRLAEKQRAMEAWSNDLIAAYRAIGGELPV
jgi:integrase